MGTLLGVLLGVAHGGDADAPDSLATVRDRGVVEVAVYADYPPFSWGSSPAEARGIDVDMARAIAAQLHLKLKLRLVSAGESASDDLRNHVWKGHYLGGGVADVMLHIGCDPAFAERESNVFIFAPYFHDAVVLAYDPRRITHVESPISLTEHKIAVEGDTISDHVMSSAYGGALRNSTVREASLEEAVAAFKAGDVDAVMGPEGELEGLFKELKLPAPVIHHQEAVGMIRTAWDVGIAVKAGGDTSLRDAVAAVIAGMKADGRLKQLFAGYGVTYTDASTRVARQIPAH